MTCTCDPFRLLAGDYRDCELHMAELLAEMAPTMQQMERELILIQRI